MTLKKNNCIRRNVKKRSNLLEHQLPLRSSLEQRASLFDVTCNMFSFFYCQICSPIFPVFSTLVFIKRSRQPAFLLSLSLRVSRRFIQRCVANAQKTFCCLFEKPVQRRRSIIISIGLTSTKTKLTRQSILFTGTYFPSLQMLPNRLQHINETHQL